jgi:hypothetical protein
MKNANAEQRLSDLACAAIDAVAGVSSRAKLGLSKAIHDACDLYMERALYKAYHDAAIDTAITAGYRRHRVYGKYSSPRGTASPEEVSTFPDAAPAETGCGSDQTVEPEPKPEPKPVWRPTANMDALRATARVIASCAMDVEMINGRPIRRCSGRECRENADHLDKKSLFRRWCAAGLTDDQIVGDCKTDAEANAFYEKELGFKLPPTTRH